MSCCGKNTLFQSRRTQLECAPPCDPLNAMADAHTGARTCVAGEDYVRAAVDACLVPLEPLLALVFQVCHLCYM